MFSTCCPEDTELGKVSEPSIQGARIRMADYGQPGDTHLVRELPKRSLDP